MLSYFSELLFKHTNMPLSVLESCSHTGPAVVYIWQATVEPELPHSPSACVFDISLKRNWKLKLTGWAVSRYEQLWFILCSASDTAWDWLFCAYYKWQWNLFFFFLNLRALYSIHPIEDALRVIISTDCVLKCDYTLTAMHLKLIHFSKIQTQAVLTSFLDKFNWNIFL